MIDYYDRYTVREFADLLGADEKDARAFLHYLCDVELALPYQGKLKTSPGRGRHSEIYRVRPDWVIQLQAMITTRAEEILQ